MDKGRLFKRTRCVYKTGSLYGNQPASSPGEKPLNRRLISTMMSAYV